MLKVTTKVHCKITLFEIVGKRSLGEFDVEAVALGGNRTLEQIIKIR